MQIWLHLQKQESPLVSKESVTTVSNTTIIDLLRHGDVEGGRKYRVQLDDPLSKLGWEQLRSITKTKQNWQHIITSPLKRCSEFASELVQIHSLPLQTKDEFKEVSFGLWEGKTADELLEAQPDKIKQYWNDPINTTPPKGENLLSFDKRVMSGWGSLLKEFQGKHILVINHAGVMRIILCRILGMPLTELFKLDIALAKASRVQIDHIDDENWPRLMFHGSEFI